MKISLKSIIFVIFIITFSAFSAVLPPSNLQILNDSPSLLPAPSDLTISYVNPNAVLLKWKSNSNKQEIGFRIESTLNTNSNWKEIASPGINVTNYTYTFSLAPNYFYRVRGHTYSTFSSVVSNISQTGFIAISWLNNAANSREICISRKTDSTAWAQVAVLPTMGWYKDTNIVNGTRYYYKVRSHEFSEYSNIAFLNTSTNTLSVSCPGTIIKIAPPGTIGYLAGFPSENETTNIFTPPSGTSFLVGTNKVTFVVSDDMGNINSCIFNIVVLSPLTNTNYYVLSQTNLIPCIVNNFIPNLPTNLPIICTYSNGTNFYGQVNASLIQSNICWAFQYWSGSSWYNISDNMCQNIKNINNSPTNVIMFTIADYISNVSTAIQLSIFPFQS